MEDWRWEVSDGGLELEGHRLEEERGVGNGLRGIPEEEGRVGCG